MGRAFGLHRNERGVTLIELLAASAILAIVITGICLWINSTWANATSIQTASANEQQATTIMSQIVQEIHNSQPDANGTYVTSALNSVTILTAAGYVSYNNLGSQVIYTNASNHPFVLSDNGTLQVQTTDQKTFTITVTVGKSIDPNHHQVIQTTTVTRYDWGK